MMCATVPLSHNNVVVRISCSVCNVVIHMKGGYCEVALFECHEAHSKRGNFKANAELAMQII